MNYKKLLYGIFEFVKIISLFIVTVYIWLASSMYLSFNVNLFSGAVCFYSGVSYLIFRLFTSIMEISGVDD